jgi:hypothetical protein
MAWSVPYRIGDYLSDPISRIRLRPPTDNGLYVVSLRPWQNAAPQQTDAVLHVGQSGNLRQRLGQLIGDCFGYTGDNPAYGDSYYHSGGHRIWHHCMQHSINPADLFLGWCLLPVCLDCGEIGFFRDLTPLLGRGVPSRCAVHNPLLPLSQVCP